ncbi:NrsF family protein [Phreatobacter sp. HK31-P]
MSPMKTDDLIATLARDARQTGPAVHRRIAIALAIAAVTAFALMMASLGVRPDLAAASTTMLFTLKMLLVATLAVAAFALVRASARPEAELPKIVLLVPVLLIVFGIGHEIATQLPANLPARLVGRNWRVCLVAIPLLGLLPLAAILTAMTAAAPRNATLAGALSGFAAGAIAAVFYGLHCTDDSPLFVATWYSLAIGMLTLAGAAVGRRLLAW